jgi:hypothetical protein
VLDPDVVDADVVTDEEAFQAAEIARHEAEEAAKAKPARASRAKSAPAKDEPTFEADSRA